jgi:hypothetical protein
VPRESGAGRARAGWGGGAVLKDRDVSTECEQRERDGKRKKAESDGSRRRAGVEILPQMPTAVPHPAYVPEKKTSPPPKIIQKRLVAVSLRRAVKSLQQVDTNTEENGRRGEATK